jgi:hypothetical protein
MPDGSPFPEFVHFSIRDLTVNASSVPGPIVGAGLPGLVAACGVLLALARRRRQLVADTLSANQTTSLTGVLAFPRSARVLLWASHAIAEVCKPCRRCRLWKALAFSAGGDGAAALMSELKI